MEENKEETKKTEGAVEETVATEGKTDAATNEISAGEDPNKSYGYKFPPELKTRIYDYLQSRPMVEVDTIITVMFETEDKDPFYTLEGIMGLVDYFKTKCPRKDGKPFVIAISQGLLKYEITVDKKEKSTEKEEVPAKG